VRLDGGEHHPIEGKEQEQREGQERHPDGEDPLHSCLRKASSAPQASTARSGSVKPAIAAPSPSAPPGIARWYASVTKRCVALAGPPRVMVQLSCGSRIHHQANAESTVGTT